MAALLGGHDYQYLLVWIAAVEALDPTKSVEYVEYEIQDGGNVDDMVIYRADQPPTYHQIKFAAKPLEDPLTCEWLMKKATEGGTSTLQKLCASYKELGGPEMYLNTNRPVAHDDPLLTQAGGHDLRLGPRLHGLGPKSDAGKALAVWREHTNLGEDELLEVLDHLHLRTGQEPFTQLRQETASLQMRAVSMQGDEKAVNQGIAIVRDRVKQNERRLDTDDVRGLADHHALWAKEAEASLVIEQAAGYPWPGIPTAVVDWRGYFADDEDHKRRRVANGASWEADLRRLLQQGVAAVQATGLRRVRVAGSPRLSGWFLAGFELRHVRGLQVAAHAGPQRWDSDGEKGTAELALADPVAIDQGEDLAVAVSIAQMAGTLAEQHIRDVGLPVGELVEIAVKGAPDSQLVRGPEHARAIVEAVYGEMASVHNGRNLHLFLAIPGALALLLGHRWNRMPSTQLYDDRGSQPEDGPGYDPTFLLASS